MHLWGRSLAAGVAAVGKQRRGTGSGQLAGTYRGQHTTARTRPHSRGLPGRAEEGRGAEIGTGSRVEAGSVCVDSGLVGAARVQTGASRVSGSRGSEVTE